MVPTWCVLAALLLLGSVATAQDPPWLHSTIGTPDPQLVPPPFTPVERAGSATGVRFGVIGRVVQCEGQPLPTGILSAGEPLLAAPMGLSVVTRHGPLALAWQTPELGERTPSSANWHGRATASGWEVDVNGSIAYDGLLQLELGLNPPASGGTLADLRLTIPFAPSRARLCSWWPGQWGSAANSGAVPADGMALPFKPLFWLGDEDRGLSVCAESDEGWVPPADGQVYRLSSDGVLTLHLVAAETTLQGRWRTRLLLHPTPIKPFPADPHALRINHGGNFGLETKPWYGPSGSVRYDASKLLDPAQGTLELWVSPGFDPNVVVDEEQRSSRGVLNRDLVNIDFANGDRAGFYWNIDDRGMRYYVRHGQEHPIVLGAANPWRTGEVHQLALTWGDAVRLYADGQLVAERPFAGLCGTAADLAGATLTLGGDTATFGVHAWRVDNVARTTFAPGPPQPAETTTLCEVGEQVGAAGTLTGGTRAPGRFGPALFFYQPDRRGNLLDGLRQAGVKTVIFHEHWTDIQDYPITPYADQLKALTQALHDRQMKLAVYFGYEMSNIAPEWERWHESCLVSPRAGGYRRQPEQTAYIVCYNSVWQNFLLEGIAHAVDAYGVDGVYLDGTIEPFGCANAAHGCGYVAPDGARHKTYPILAVRRLMQRMYTLLAARRDQPIIDAHQSLCMMSPTLSWCSGYWDGEQLTSHVEAGRPPLEYLPLDTFRAEFMGRQWGVPAQFLNYAGRPFQPPQAMAFSLLHDVLPRGRGMDSVQQLVTPIWQVLDKLPRSACSFVGYWSPDRKVAATGDGVEVSYYDRGGEAAVLVVSNLSGQAVDAVVRLADDWLPGGLRVADALGGAAPPVTGREIRLTLQPLEYRLLEVRPAR